MSEDGKKKGFFKEFIEFINKGNVIDLAIAFVMGVAFQAIVKSLVDDIIMPVIWWMFRVDMTKLETELKHGDTVSSILKWGNFIQSVINFLLIALTIFVALKIAMKVSNVMHNISKPLHKKEIEKSDKATEEKVAE